MILKKHLKDGYIDYLENVPQQFTPEWQEILSQHHYYKTFEGGIFSMEGGYEGNADRRNAESIRLDALETYQRAQPRTLSRLTGWIAGGTIALALIDGKNVAGISLV